MESDSEAQDEEYSGKKGCIKVLDKTERSWCYKVIKKQPAIFKPFQTTERTRVWVRSRYGLQGTNHLGLSDHDNKISQGNKEPVGAS